MVSRRTFVAGAVATPFLASSSMTSAAQDDAQVTLKVSFNDNAVDTLIESFHQDNPAIVVEQSAGGLSFEDGTIQTTLQSGQGPDVLATLSGPSRIGVLAVNGLILPLDDFYQRAGLFDVYLPTVIKDLETQAPAGEIYELPWGFDVFQFYYWKDTFEANGLQPPESWEDFITICQTLHDAGVTPIALGVRDNFMGGWLLGNLVQASAGRELMSEVIYGDGDFTHPDVIRAAELFKQLVDDGYINGLEAASLAAAQAEAAFVNGEGAMIVVGQGALINMGKDGADLDNIGSFLLPSLREGQAPAATGNLAVSWVVNAETDKLDEAEAWLEWAASDEYLKIETEGGGAYVPARSIPDGVTMPAPIQDASEKLENAGFNPSAYFPAAAKDAWYAALQLIITDQASPQDAIALVQQALEESRAGR